MRRRDSAARKQGLRTGSELGDNAKQLNAIRKNVKGHPSSGTERVSRKSEQIEWMYRKKNWRDGYGRVADLKMKIRKTLCPIVRM